MILWEATQADGERIFTCYNEYMVQIATITGDGDEWICDLDPDSPGPLRVLKDEVDEIIQWATSLLGSMTDDPIEAEVGETEPYMQFVDDDMGAVWQVWEVR